jgi:hypothetical protein
MYVCMCMLVCLCVSKCVRVGTIYTSAYLLTIVCVNSNLRKCVCACVYVYVSVFVLECMHMYVRISM